MDARGVWAFSLDLGPRTLSRTREITSPTTTTQTNYAHSGLLPRTPARAAFLFPFSPIPALHSSSCRRNQLPQMVDADFEFEPLKLKKEGFEQGEG